MDDEIVIKEDLEFFMEVRKYFESQGCKWTEAYRDRLLDKIDEQKVFERAKEKLRNYFGLNLSLGQQIELRRIYVPSALKDYKKQATHFNADERIDFPEREAAARFVFNNFSITSELIERSLNCAPLICLDEQAYLYLQHQQYEMLKL